MSELHIDEILGAGYNDALFSGTRDSDTGIWYREKGAGLDFYKNIVRMIWNTIETARIAKMFRLYVDSTDSALQFSLTGGAFWYGGALVTVNPAININLSPSATNLIWLLTDGSINVGTTWPNPGTTPHIRIGEIVTGATSWDITSDWTDRRSESMYAMSGPTTSEQTIDISSQLFVAAFTNASGASPQDCEVTIKDINGNDPPAEQRLILSIHADIDGGDVYDTDATIAVGPKGTLIGTSTTDKELFVKTNVAGEVTITVTKPTPGLCYLIARTYRRGAILDCRSIGTITIS